ncbi:hypothetical protein [Phormidesmis priestleyi]
MYSSQSQGEANKGSVQFKATKGCLQIVFSYPAQEGSEIKRKRFYISTGYEDTPIDRQRVGDTVRTLQRDIDYGEVDLSLAKYQPYAALSTVSSIPPISPIPSAKPQPTLSELWERYTEFKQPQVSPSTFCKDYTKQQNHIRRFPSQSLDDAIAIRDYLLSNLTPDAAKRCVSQLKACCDWAVEDGIIEANPFSSMKIKAPKGLTEDEDVSPFSKEERDLIIQMFESGQLCCAEGNATTSTTPVMCASCFSQAHVHQKRLGCNGSTSPRA